MTEEIVDPEPHSPRNLGNGWEHIPRWERLVLYAIAVSASLLLAYFAR